MYAIIRTGGKQYRVEPGRWLLIERLPDAVDSVIDLQTLLVVDGDEMLDGAALEGVTVKAKILAHERGPKLRVVKFKPKRGYKRRNGHRQELTRIEVTGVDRGSKPAKAKAKPKAVKAEEPVAATASEGSDGA
jgi:large subunit ribosomal protein L21